MDLTRSLLHIGPRSRSRFERSTFTKLVFLAIALSMLVGYVVMIVFGWKLHTAPQFAAAAFGLIVYLFLGYFVHPRPEKARAKLFDGVLGPQSSRRTVADVLILFQLPLFPARFVSESLVDAIKLWRARSQVHPVALGDDATISAGASQSESTGKPAG